MPPVSVEEVNTGVEELLTKLAKRTAFLDVTDNESLEACYAILNDVHHRISTTLNRRNRKALIHRLPEEVLVAIFELYLPVKTAPEGWRYYQALSDLILVCKSWADIISARPTFWAFLSSYSSPTILEMALKKSGEAPLTIHMLHPHEPSRNTLLRLMQPHVTRCKALEFVVNPPLEQALFTVLFQCVKTLRRISIFSEQFSILAWDMFRDVEPNLSEVTLVGVAGIADCVWLSSLTSLTLDQITLSYEVMINLLRASPGLDHFSLQSPDIIDLYPLEDAERERDEDHDFPQIIMKYLTSLVVAAKPNIVGDVLNRIRAPLLCRAHIGIHPLVPPPPDDHPEADDHVAKSIVGFYSKCERGALYLTLGANGFVAVGDDFSLIYGGSTMGLGTYKPILDQLPGSMFLPVQTLAIPYGIVGCKNMLHWAHNRMPNVSHLLVTYNICLGHNGLSELRRPRHMSPVPEAPPEWLLPKLQTLDIVDSSRNQRSPRDAYLKLLRRVLNFVKARKQAADDTRDGAPSLVESVSIADRFDMWNKGVVLMEELNRTLPNIKSSLGPNGEPPHISLWPSLTNALTTY